MVNIEYLTDPVLITLTGNEITLPAGIKCIKPNSGCIISSLKKTSDNTTNYATTYATTAITSDNYTFISCGGDGKYWTKINGTAAGTCWAYKNI